MNNTNNTNNTKIRTVNVNKRGQIVIPDDIRKDLGIVGNTTVVLIERNGEFVIKKEAEILRAIDSEDMFWNELSKISLSNMWDEKDEVWDKIARSDLKAK